jgi:hypothetical protein
MPIQESEAVPRILEADAELPNRKSDSANLKLQNGAPLGKIVSFGGEGISGLFPRSGYSPSWLQPT